MGKVSGFFKKFKANKHFELILAIVLCIIVVVIFLSSFWDFSDSASTSGNLFEYNANLEKKLCELILALGDVKSVSVAITFSSGTQNVYAYETTTVTNGGTTTETKEIVYVDGSPLLIQEVSPEILGVAVVAKGSNSAVLKMQITEIVVKLFNISSNKIQVITYSN